MYRNISFEVDRGLRGYFAVMYDNDGPIQTGIGSFDNPKNAAIEAWEWAMEEDYPMEAARLKKKYDL